MNEPVATTTPTYDATSFLQRRWPTVAGLAATGLLWAVGLLHDFAQGLVVAGLIYWVWGALRGHLKSARWLALETGGVVLFAGVMVAGLAVDPRVGTYILAAGWFGHAVWDYFHYRADRVVPRWYAEACAATDLLLTALLLVLPVT